MPLWLSGVAQVIVVGGGVGGLALAGRLARARPGWEVVLFEKNARGVISL